MHIFSYQKMFRESKISWFWIFELNAQFFNCYVRHMVSFYSDAKEYFPILSTKKSVRTDLSSCRITLIFKSILQWKMKKKLVQKNIQNSPSISLWLLVFLGPKIIILFGPRSWYASPMLMRDHCSLLLFSAFFVLDNKVARSVPRIASFWVKYQRSAI